MVIHCFRAATRAVEMISSLLSIAWPKVIALLEYLNCTTFYTLKIGNVTIFFSLSNILTHWWDPELIWILTHFWPFISSTIELTGDLNTRQQWNTHHTCWIIVLSHLPVWIGLTIIQGTFVKCWSYSWLVHSLGPYSFLKLYLILFDLFI